MVKFLIDLTDFSGEKKSSRQKRLERESETVTKRFRRSAALIVEGEKDNNALTTMRYVSSLGYPVVKADRMQTEGRYCLIISEYVVESELRNIMEKHVGPGFVTGITNIGGGGEYPNPTARIMVDFNVLAKRLQEMIEEGGKDIGDLSKQQWRMDAAALKARSREALADKSVVSSSSTSEEDEDGCDSCDSSQSESEDFGAGGIRIGAGGIRAGEIRIGGGDFRAGDKSRMYRKKEASAGLQIAAKASLWIFLGFLSVYSVNVLLGIEVAILSAFMMHPKFKKMFSKDPRLKILVAFAACHVCYACISYLFPPGAGLKPVPEVPEAETGEKEDLEGKVGDYWKEYNPERFYEEYKDWSRSSGEEKH